MKNSTYERYKVIAQKFEQSGLSLSDFYKANLHNISNYSLASFRVAMANWYKEHERRTAPYKIVSSSQNQDNQVNIVELEYSEVAGNNNTIVTVAYENVSFSVTVNDAPKFIANTIMELNSKGLSSVEEL